MWRLAGLAALAVGRAACGGATKAAQPADIEACLTAKKLLPLQAARLVVPGEVQIAGFGFSFAFVPEAAENNGAIAVEHSAAEARAIADRFVKSEVKRIQDTGLTVTEQMLRNGLWVESNSIVVWNNDPGVTPPGRDLAKRTLAECLG
jgi:hypothetical protein